MRTIAPKQVADSVQPSEGIPKSNRARYNAGVYECIPINETYPGETPPSNLAPEISPKYMTDAQVAASPLFPLIQRVTKAMRTFGPTSKRPILDASDKGFEYVDNTLNVTVWWYGTNWRDSMGAVR